MRNGTISRLYNGEDVRVLPELYFRLKEKIKAIYQYGKEDFQKLILEHSKWGARVATISRTGFPLDMAALDRLTEAHPGIVKYMQHEINATVYPIFMAGKEKYDRKAQWIRSLNSDVAMARTPLVICFKKDVLKACSHPVVADLLKQLNNLNSINRFAPDGEVRDMIGSDGYTRSGLIPYGTSTGRNSHKARHYILAMSSWLRCLLRPRPGDCIVAADYGRRR